LRLWQPPAIERPTIRVVAPEELAGGKLVAFFDRAAPRDAYDVANLPDLGVPGWRAHREWRCRVRVVSAAPPGHCLEG
jgi:predicted nucleotidyltransferase component of viral defense system